MSTSHSRDSRDRHSRDRHGSSHKKDSYKDDRHSYKDREKNDRHGSSHSRDRHRDDRRRERDVSRSPIRSDKSSGQRVSSEAKKPHRSEPDFENPRFKTEKEEPLPVDKEAPNFEVSGKLLEDTNTFNGVVIKYSEPPEARKPKRRWRFYVFKEEESLPTLHLHRQSAFLIGKDRKICDLPIDHPSCSRQHAVLQYRLVNRERADGSKSGAILPYIIDLGSSNGTYLNNQIIEPRRYIELKEKDVLKFGFSSREYVMLHDQSHGADDSD